MDKKKSGTYTLAHLGPTEGTLLTRRVTYAICRKIDGTRGYQVEQVNQAQKAKYHVCSCEGSRP
jgi:hypothetical protein